MLPAKLHLRKSAWPLETEGKESVRERRRENGSRRARVGAEKGRKTLNSAQKFEQTLLIKQG